MFHSQVDLFLLMISISMIFHVCLLVLICEVHIQVLHAVMFTCTHTRACMTCPLCCAGCSTCHCPSLVATTLPIPRSLRLWSSTAKTAIPRQLSCRLSALVSILNFSCRAQFCGTDVYYRGTLPPGPPKDQEKRFV